MHRRGFLGAVIGSFVATSLPFVAKPHLLPFSRKLTIREIVDLVSNHADELDLFYVIGDKQEIIRTTPVVAVEHFDDKVVFKLEPWRTVVEKLTVHHVGYSHQGVEIHRCRIDGGSVPLNRGDTLKCTYTISWEPNS